MAEHPSEDPRRAHEPVRVEPDVRFSLANERTLLAYQRTAVGLTTAAVAIVHFFGDGLLVAALGGIFLLTAAVAAVGGYAHFRRVDAAIREGRSIGAGPAAHALSVALLVSLVVAAAYVVVQAG